MSRHPASLAWMRASRWAAAAAVGGIFASLGGCIVMGPDYQRPVVAMPDNWQHPLPPSAVAPAAPAASAAAVTAGAAAAAPAPDAAELADLPWWSAFGDPELDRLIEDALVENKDVRIAAFRVEQFRSRKQIAAADNYPQAKGSGERTRESLSQNRIVPLAAGVYPVGNNYEVYGSATWELDFWGKVKRSNEASIADFLATEESRRSLVLSVVSDLASSYVSLLSLDRELELHRQVTESRATTLELLEKKLEDGGVAELQVHKSRAEYEESRTTLSDKEQEIATLENVINALAGRNPQPVPRGRAIATLTPPVIPAGLPVQLLERRPDIRQTEQELVAANARIGVAKSQYLPSIGLTVGSGQASAEFSSFTDVSSNISRFGVTIFGPLFTAGRIAGQVSEAEAIQREKQDQYLKTVQTALREVENALVAFQKTSQRQGIRDRQLKALLQYSDSAQRRYDGGRSSFLDVLDAQRNLYAGQIQANQTSRDLLISLISIYKSMGGGWTVAPGPSNLASASSTSHE